jgi:NADPH-ferrihemoprotein reductase
MQHCGSPITPPRPAARPARAGVAPFRGFLQQRRALLAAAAPALRAAPALLYFGCRRPDEDFLYRGDLEAAAADGTLAQLRTAFSRQGADKVYVQHLMAADGAQLAPLLQAGAYVFVCGDGGGMARGVHAALRGVLREHCGLGEAEAEARLAAMAREGRYVRDVWGA